MPTLWQHRIYTLLLTGILLLPQAISAEPIAQRPAGRQLSHREILNRANDLVSVLSSEITLQQGDGSSALATYMYLFRKNHDPAVAERAVEIALDANERLAEQVLAMWRDAEPSPSPEQKRMRWS